MWRTGTCYAGELFLAHRIRELPEWESHPVFDGRLTKRVAPSYFLEVYRRSGSGEAYASGWLADRELQNHPLGDELRCWLFMVDASLFYDGLDVLNSAGFEWIARRCYSIERVLVEIQSLSQAYALLEIYDAALLKEPPLKLQQRRRLRRRKHALMRSKRKVGRA